MRLKLCVIEHFDAAHYLPGHESCGSMHGHTYRVEVVIEGELRDNMLMDFAELRKLVREVLAEYDHAVLNELLEYPSAENLCTSIFKKLKQRLRLPLKRVRLWEGEGKWVQIEG